MSTPEEPDWVRQGTPRDVDAEWNDEQSEYGTTVSPVEWDDYSSEQSVPVARPRPVAQPPAEGQTEGAETADHPAAQADEPVTDPAPAAGAQEAVTADEQAEASDDAAVVGAPLEEQPVLTDEVSDQTTVPVQEAPVDEPTLSDEPAFVDEPALADEQAFADEPALADEAVQDPFVDEPVASPDPDPFGEPGQADEDPTTDIPAPVTGSAATAYAAEEGAGESYEEESFDEPVADEYDEPRDDEPVTAGYDTDAGYEATGQEPAADEPLAEDMDPEATRVAPAYVPEEEVADESLADDPTADETVVQDVDDDPDATRVVPVAVGAAGATAAAGGSPLPDDLYRTGETAVIDDREALAARAREADEAEARERELQAQLDAERRARDERLGVVATSPENEVRDPATAYKVSTDRFFGSLGLFVMRLVAAAVLGITGYQVLTNVDRTTEFLGQTMIPEPRLVTWIVGFTLGALALLLVIGLLQRVVGVLLLLLSIGSLVFIRWGTFSPFVEGREGFLGDKTLLLAAIAFVLIGVGGGLWGVDGAFRRARAAAKAERH